ncbi:MAG: hypothetical protein HQL31_13115, partial [Planctomycetes bacterium]|nr:hypothetical protein [Planctomycetota bacterium]
CMNLKFFGVIILLTFSAAVSNAVMDTLQFRYEQSVFANDSFSEAYFNPKVSWKNKWKNGDPKEGERYLGSSTVFVLFTDAWHLAQFFMFSFFELIFVYTYYFFKKPKWYVLILQFLVLHFVLGSSFELFFSKLFIA